MPPSWLDAIAGERGIKGKEDSSLTARTGEIGVCSRLRREAQSLLLLLRIGTEWAPFSLECMTEEEEEELLLEKSGVGALFSTRA